VSKLEVVKQSRGYADITDKNLDQLDLEFLETFKKLKYCIDYIQNPNLEVQLERVKQSPRYIAYIDYIKNFYNL